MVEKVVAGATPKTSIDAYWNDGNIPWLSSGEVHKKRITFTDKFITKEGYDNSSTKMIPINSVLIALAGQGKTRGTVAINKIELCTNQSIASIIPNENKLYYQFLYYCLESKYEYLRRLSSSDGGRGGLNLKLIRSVKINVPSIKEQKKISSIISVLEDKITLMEKKMLIHKIIRNSYIDDFYIENEQKFIPLGNFIKQVSTKNKDNEKFEVLSINNKKGFVKQKEQFGDYEVASSDKHNYKIIHNGNYAYNPARINVGSIARLDEFNDGIISPMYIMFDIKNKELLSDYLKFYFESKTFRYNMLKRLEGSVRQTLSFDALKNIPISIPNYEVQKIISKFLKAYEQEIDLLQQKINNNKKYKQTLLSKMFC